MVIIFDYQKAWIEYVNPEFNKILPIIIKPCGKLLEIIESVSQIGSTNAVSGADSVDEYFDDINILTLAHSAKIVYYLGHFGINNFTQKHGFYWKFEIVADKSVVKRMGDDFELKNKINLIKVNIEEKLKQYVSL